MQAAVNHLAQPGSLTATNYRFEKFLYLRALGVIFHTDYEMLVCWKNNQTARGTHQEDLMTASSLSFRLAVLCVIAGMGMGIGMAATQNHAIMPAHAHLNLLGWVSLFLFGIYYERRPALDTSRLAMIQVYLWTAGTILLTIAVAAIHLGYEAADPIAGISSLMVLGAMLLFAYFVFRPAHAVTPKPHVRMTPAE
jgi:hypothetical protein